MHIDHQHKSWAIGTALVSAAATALCLVDASTQVNGARGSTPVGLTLGFAALALMLFCAGLGLKRRVPHWRLGKAQTWMRGHLWLGLLTALLIALHGGLRVGGAMGIVLWTLVAIVTFSGIVGAVLQLLVPSLLMHSVPGETVAQQLEKELASLVSLARYEVDKYAKIPYDSKPHWTSLAKPDDDAVASLPRYRPAPGEPAPPVPGAEQIGVFYLDHIRPFLTGGESAQLATTTRSAILFESLRVMTPASVHPGVRSLEEICERRRLLLHQRKLMRILTWWLLVHVPLSWLLLLLSCTHAIAALRFSW